jgi:hypothetical protein
MLADLVVLGTDPWQVPVDALPDVPVDEVWIGGEVRYPIPAQAGTVASSSR